MSALSSLLATSVPVSTPLTLAAFETLEVVFIFVAALVGIAIGFFLVQFLTNQRLTSAKAEAKKLVDDARNQAQVEAEKARVEGEKALL